MYDIVGVKRPSLDYSKLDSLADAYQTAAQAFAEAKLTTDASVNGIRGKNKGPTTDKFASAMTTLPAHLTTCAEAAARTSMAYRTAAMSGRRAQVAMDAVAVRGLAQYKAAPSIIRPFIAFQVRQRLVVLETVGKQQITDAFADLNLPAPLSEYGDSKYVQMPEEVQTKWASLGRDKQMEILQKIADDYCRKNGLPLRKLTFTPLGDVYGDSNSKTGEVRINSDMLNDAEQIATVIHELEHQRQSVAEKEYRNIRNTPGLEEKIASGQVPDPLAKYNMTTADARRLTETQDHNVGDQGYWNSPHETGARRAERHYADGVTVQELEEMAK